MKYQKRGLIQLVALGTAQVALADPTAFPPRDSFISQVHNQTNSVVMADTNNPRVFWVMPPNGGMVTPGGLTGASANLNMCDQMSDLQASSATIAKKINDVQVKFAEADADGERLKDEYFKLLSKAEAVKATNADLDRYLNIQAEITSLRNRLNADYDRMNTCGDESGAACQQVQADIEHTREQLTADQNLMNEVTPQIAEQIQIYNQKKAVAEAKHAEWDEASTQAQKYLTSLSDLRTLIMGFYSDLAKFEGGFSTISYSLGWTDNVLRLQQDNPHFSFSQIMTHNAVMNVGFVGGVGKDAYLGSLPAILDYSVNGKAYAPYGNDQTQTLASVPDFASATLRLSLVGACPLAHPEKFDLPKGTTGLPQFGASMLYEFPSAFSSKVTFTYKLTKFYELIKKSATKNGLFSSSSWSETSENKLDNDAFSADWTGSDPDGFVSAESRRAVEKELKAELMTRVLKEMATPVLGDPNPSAAPAVPVTGVMVLAEGVSQTCGWYSIWCTGASWVLRGLGSIFGGSSSEQHFVSNHEGSATETWSESQTRWKPAAVVFSTRN